MCVSTYIDWEAFETFHGSRYFPSSFYKNVVAFAKILQSLANSSPSDYDRRAVFGFLRGLALQQIFILLNGSWIAPDLTTHPRNLLQVKCPSFNKKITAITCILELKTLCTDNDRDDRTGSFLSAL